MRKLEIFLLCALLSALSYFATALYLRAVLS